MYYVSLTEDEDVFQCGKCKAKYTSLSAFVSHKQTRCAPPTPAAATAVTLASTVIAQRPSGATQVIGASPHSAFTATNVSTLLKQVGFITA